MNERAAGILLAVSSLPSPFGIGSFGKAAREWLSFLKECGQRYWQILPLGPTGWGDSPYQSFSAFAISPYYIDLETLIEEGLLTPGEVNAVNWGKRTNAVDYGILYRRREGVLRLACMRFREVAAKDKTKAAAFDSFCREQNFWLGDYCLFMALKKKNNGLSWIEWKEEEKLREDSAMQKVNEDLQDDIYYHSFMQYKAFTQWQEIREYAKNLGIAIIGDMPIYVAADSADTWANSDLFLLDENRKPLRIAGCPPDAFSSSGQIWGNPLYRWDIIAENKFSWWIDRLRSTFMLCDIVRIDHFRGLESYFSIDAETHNAFGGVWVKGPGLAFIEAVNSSLPNAAIIAEDLGYLTVEVKELLKASGYPGMKVLQFAFDSREASDYMPHLYERNCVVYTGTHDNATSRGWFKAARSEDIAVARDYFGIKNDSEGHWAFIRTALASAANTAIIPMQDYLGLDNKGRMNTPSTLGGGNWRWRMLPGAASPELAKKIHRLITVCARH